MHRDGFLVFGMALCLAFLVGSGAVVCEAGAQSTKQRATQAADSASTPQDSLYSVTMRRVPLATALERFATLTQASLAYDADLVDGHHAYCAIHEARTEPLLRCILDGTPLDYVRTSAGTYVVVASPRRAPRRGQIAGVVVDSTTGEPLPHAHVYLADASVGTSADVSGLFQLSSLVSGEHRVVASYVGYEPSVARVVVEPGAKVRRRIELSPRAIAAEPVVIDGMQPRLASAGLGHGDVEPGSIARRSGQAGTPDVARAASELIGVSTRSPLADLHIQGGGDGEHEMRLDGVPVRNPVSLGRLLSAFSPMALGRLTTHKAGFGAMEGSYLSGVIDLSHDLSRRDTRWAQVAADPLSVNGRAQGTFSAGAATVEAVGAARVGLWDTYPDPTLYDLIDEWSTLDPVLARAWQASTRSWTTGVQGDVSLDAQRRPPSARFSDWHGAARVSLSPYESLYVSGYHGRSTIGAGLLVDGMQVRDGNDADALAPTYDRYAWRNTTGQARYTRMVGSRVIATARTYVSHYKAASGYALGPVSFGDPTVDRELLPSPEPLLGSEFEDLVVGDRNRIAEAGADAGVEVSVSPRTSINARLGVDRVESRFQIRNAFVPAFEHDVTATRWTFASNAEVSLGARTTLDAGTRLTYVVPRRTVYAEPRVAVRTDRTFDRIGDLGVRVAAGLYRQFTNQFSLSRDGASTVVPSARVWIPTGRAHAPPRAIHLTTEAVLVPSDHWQVNLEAYLKEQPHLLEIDYPALTDPASERNVSSRFIGESRGRAAGVGLRVAYAAGRASASVAYDLSHAVRTFPNRFDGEAQPTPWNEPHRVSVRGSVPLAAGFSLEGAWTGVWGRSWGFRKAYYDFLGRPSGGLMNPTAGEVRVLSGALHAADFTTPGTDRLPPIYRLDFGLAFRESWNGVDVSARLRVANVLGRDNVADWSLRPGPDGLTRLPRTLPGFHPSLMIRIGY